MPLHMGCKLLEPHFHCNANTVASKWDFWFFLALVLFLTKKYTSSSEVLFFVLFDPQECGSKRIMFSFKKKVLSGISLSPLYKGDGHCDTDVVPRASPVISFFFSPLTHGPPCGWKILTSTLNQSLCHSDSTKGFPC